MCNKICKRIYYAIDVQLKSPLCISNGEDYYTDADVLTNGNGEYFVPGTSLAGAFRNYLNNKNEFCFYFGYLLDGCFSICPRPGETDRYENGRQ